jgi:DNA-directed RNA polymerase alpha subunit
VSEEHKERCGNCRFRVSLPILDPDGRWRPNGASHDGITEAEYDKSHEDASGECHRYPPITTDGLFPDVRVDDWCGEWKAKEPDRAAIMDEPISALLLSVRITDAIERLIYKDKSCKMATVGILANMTEKELRSSSVNFRKTCLSEVRSALATHGLKLRGD